MKLKTICLHALGLCLLGAGGLPTAWAQTDSATAPAATLSTPLALPAPVVGEALAAPTTPAAQPDAGVRLDQVWDVVEVMGRPLEPSSRRARLVIRSPGTLLVDGGCNYFSGRLERGADGLFRVTRYSGTHNQCQTPSRAEAVLNSALLMVNNYRVDAGLVLRSGEMDLVRLAPSAQQDSSAIEQAVERVKPAPRAASRSARAHHSAKKGAKASQVKAGKAKSAKTAAQAKGAKAGKTAKVGKSAPSAKPVQGAHTPKKHG